VSRCDSTRNIGQALDPNFALAQVTVSRTRQGGVTADAEIFCAGYLYKSNMTADGAATSLVALVSAGETQPQGSHESCRGPALNS
jgi:hypothetical protein